MSGNGPLDVLANLIEMITRTEMRGQDPLVAEAIDPLQKVVEVHVPELVDLVLAMAGGDEGHLHDQHLGLVHGLAGVQPGRCAVAEVSHAGNADFGRDVGSAQTQVANLVAGQALELRLQLPPPLPDHEAQRRNRMHRGGNGHDQFPRKLDLIARPGRQKFARQAAPDRACCTA